MRRLFPLFGCRHVWRKSQIFARARNARGRELRVEYCNGCGRRREVTS